MARKRKNNKAKAKKQNRKVPIMKPIFGVEVSVKFLVINEDQTCPKELLSTVEEVLGTIDDEYVIQDFDVNVIYEEEEDNNDAAHS